MKIVGDGGLSQHLDFSLLLWAKAKRETRGSPSPSDDASEARWATSEELDDLPASQATREVLKNIAHLGPIWEQFDHDVS